MADTAVDAVAIRDAVEIFYGKLLGDPALSGMWQHVDMVRLKGHQRKFLLQALGGPSLYAGRDMQAAHASLGISDEQFTLTIAHLIDSLREVGVAPDVVERARTDLQRLRPLIVRR
ncbi:MAG TPA: group 1 truncated hemoglobin [Pseudolysinimonas sp.]|nr:group 1 truncated hemoglobin [Pseudolysinimonas sp.]